MSSNLYSLVYCVEFLDPCERGQYHSISDDQCKPCPLNSYNDQEGVVSCQACPKGSLTVKTGSIQKSDCIGKICFCCLVHLLGRRGGGLPVQCQELLCVGGLQRRLFSTLCKVHSSLVRKRGLFVGERAVPGQCREPLWLKDYGGAHFERSARTRTSTIDGS